MDSRAASCDTENVVPLCNVGHYVRIGNMQGDKMITAETLRYELTGRLADLYEVMGKNHISVRWEPRPAIARVGMCVEHYNWATRMTVLERLLDFEQAHKDELALEFDIIPLDAVRDEEFAEA